MSDLHGIPVRACEWLPATERNTVARPRWQRWMAWLYRPWRRPRMVESMVWYQTRDGLLTHPDNVRALEQQLAQAAADKAERKGE